MCRHDSRFTVCALAALMLLLLAVPMVGCGNSGSKDDGDGNGSTSPKADFSCDPTGGNAPLTVRFTDESTGDIDSWAWDFDNDGEVDSTQQNPTHVYETAGTYTVSLKVTGSGGHDSETKSGLVEVSTAANHDYEHAWMERMPVTTGDSYQFGVSGDLAAMRAEGGFGQYLDQWESDPLWGRLGISPSDADRLSQGGGVEILEGHFDLAAIRDHLADSNYDLGAYKGVETWEASCQDEYGCAAALLDESCIVVAHSVDYYLQNAIDVIKGDASSLADEEGVSDVMARLPSGLFEQFQTNEAYVGCEAWGMSMSKQDSDAVKYTQVILFQDEVAAGEAEVGIEHTFTEYDNAQVTQDGRFIIVTAEMGIDQVG